jgi:hypothetical protein
MCANPLVVDRSVDMLVVGRWKEGILMSLGDCKKGWDRITPERRIEVTPCPIEPSSLSQLTKYKLYFMEERILTID